MQNKWIITLFLLASLFVVPFCFVRLFRFLQRYWPVPPECKQLSPLFKELEKKYRKWDLLGGLFAIPLGFFGGYISWWLGRELCAWRAGFFAGQHLLFPKHELCLLPAVPGGIVIGMAGALILYRVLLKSRFDEFACFGCLEFGMDVVRLIRAMLLTISAFWIISLLILMNTYMVLSTDTLRFSSLTDFGQTTYRYADIQSIDYVTKIRNQFKQETFIEILFKDGHRWSSSDTEEMSKERATIIAGYVAQRADVQINQRMIKRKP